MIWEHMIHFSLMKEGRLLHNQDSVEVQEEHFTSRQDLAVQHKVLISIPMKYSKCSSLVAVVLRCLPMSFQIKIMKEVIPLPKCLEEREWVALQASLVCFPLCKVKLQVHLEVCRKEISILDSHLQEAALVQHLLQDFNSKIFPQMINKSKRNEGIILIF